MKPRNRQQRLVRAMPLYYSTYHTTAAALRELLQDTMHVAHDNRLDFEILLLKAYKGFLRDSEACPTPPTVTDRALVFKVKVKG